MEQLGCLKTLSVFLWQHAATALKLTERSNSLTALNYNLSKEQCMLPEDDCVIETM